MDGSLPGERTRIDVETWERRAVYEFFRGFSEPFHGVCLRMDCTETFDFAKGQHLSVFLALLHRSLLAANSVENFRLRIAEGDVWRYEQIHGGSAVGRPNGTIGFGYYAFQPNIYEFVTQAALEVERVKQRDDLERYAGADLIRYSVLPWFDFTSISHARDFSMKDDSAPRITFGKISARDGRSSMPVSIHVHHALADGSHVAEFIELFQQFLSSPELDRA